MKAAMLRWPYIRGCDLASLIVAVICLATCVVLAVRYGLRRSMLVLIGGSLAMIAVKYLRGPQPPAGFARLRQEVAPDATPAVEPNSP
jgi:hypothetical protein